MQGSGVADTAGHVSPTSGNVTAGRDAKSHVTVPVLISSHISNSTSSPHVVVPMR